MIISELMDPDVVEKRKSRKLYTAKSIYRTA